MVIHRWIRARSARASNWLRSGVVWLASGAVLLAVLSLGLNLYLLLRLGGAEGDARRTAAALLDRLAAEDARIHYEVRLPAGAPIRLDIPLDEQLSVRVDTRLPIDTRIQVPLRTPFGTQTVEIPIRAQIPIRTVLPLRIRHTFQLRTRTQDTIVVPLELRVRDLPLDALRDALRP